MFQPTREQVRQFFFDAWGKHRRGEPLVGLEVVAVDIMRMHPEYHVALDDTERSLDRDYAPEGGESNPFLHMSLHLAIEEQLAIDQPPGIRAEFKRIAAQCGDRHDALHVVLECLGEAIWEGQRLGAGPDAAAYLDCVRRR
ncbi:MAG: DUF1841 family protein [Betaproteobacteria bacterium]|jgi:hypothetical protein|nr:DUF1841 family protein [Betaproteobacteria bacterium]